MLLAEKLQHMLFGRKSENVLRQIEQLELQLQESQAASAIGEYAAAASVARPVAGRPFPRPLPQHPRSVVRTDIGELSQRQLPGPSMHLHLDRWDFDLQGPMHLTELLELPQS
jgi:hypothetical protein